MCRIVALIASFALLAGTAPAWSQNPAQVAEWMEELAKPEHAKRIDAARALARLPSLPESALRPIIDYLRLEATEVGKQTGSRGESIPVVGDEVSLAKIVADLLSYLDRPFVLSGWLTLRPGTVVNGYDYQFANAKNTHLLFDLHLAGSDGRKSLEQVKVFLPRCVGSVLSNQQGIRVRLRCLIQSANIERCITETFHNRLTNSSRIDSVERAWQALLRDQFKPCVLGGMEAIDWQVLTPEGKKWTPWTLDAISVGYRLLAKVVKAVSPKGTRLRHR